MKDVVGYESLYAVTPEGDVYGYKRKKFLKPGVNKNGYMYVYLSKDNKLKKHYIHRIVAMAYIPNPENLTEVDHKDNNKTNNCVNNLQWLSHKDNSRKSNNKPILQYDLDGNFVKEWESATDVGKEVRINIVMCLTGKNKTALGYIWKYKESEV